MLCSGWMYDVCSSDLQVIFRHRVHHSKTAGLAAGARQRPTTVDIQNIRDCNWRDMIVAHLALGVSGDDLAHSKRIIVIAEAEELVHPFPPAVGKLSAGSDERRDGQEGVRPCSTRGSRVH